MRERTKADENQNAANQGSTGEGSTDSRLRPPIQTGGAIVITSNGIYLVAVNPANNPTYLSDGFYHVTIEKPRKDKTLIRAHARFENLATGSGTGDRIALLNVFEQQGRVVCTPMIEQWELDQLAQVEAAIAKVGVAQ
jgi:hypothetical protein